MLWHQLHHFTRKNIFAQEWTINNHSESPPPFDNISCIIVLRISSLLYIIWSWLLCKRWPWWKIKLADKVQRFWDFLIFSSNNWYLTTQQSISIVVSYHHFHFFLCSILISLILVDCGFLEANNSFQKSTKKMILDFRSNFRR